MKNIIQIIILLTAFSTFVLSKDPTQNQYVEEFSLKPASAYVNSGSTGSGSGSKKDDSKHKHGKRSSTSTSCQETFSIQSINLVPPYDQDETFQCSLPNQRCIQTNPFEFSIETINNECGDQNNTASVDCDHSSDQITFNGIQKIFSGNCKTSNKIKLFLTCVGEPNAFIEVILEEDFTAFFGFQGAIGRFILSGENNNGNDQDETDWVDQDFSKQSNVIVQARCPS